MKVHRKAAAPDPRVPKLPLGHGRHGAPLVFSACCGANDVDDADDPDADAGGKGSSCPGSQLFEARGELIGQRPVLRRGEAMKSFYEKLRQHQGEAMVAWLGRFRDACTVLEENGVGIENQEVKGWWLQHKSELTVEQEQSILTATTMSYWKSFPLISIVVWTLSSSVI